MSLFQDLTGKKFGKLKVIKYVGRNKFGQSMWLCKCDCGNFYTLSGNSFKTGKTKSCGCYRSEFKKINAKYNYIKHRRLYNIWSNIKNRCYCKSSTDYQWYGEKGISVCNEWLDNFDNFLEWSLANGYKDNLTIDRIDNNANYEPNNCRWVENELQSKNRNYCTLTYNGETYTYDEWSKKIGVKKNTIFARKNIANLPIDEVLYKGDLRKKMKEKYNG